MALWESQHAKEIKKILEVLDKDSLKATASTACKGRFPGSMGHVEVILRTTIDLDKFFGYQRITGPVLRIYLQKKKVRLDTRLLKKDLILKVKQLWGIEDNTKTDVDSARDDQREGTVDEGGSGRPITSGITSRATTLLGKRSASPVTETGNDTTQAAKRSKTEPQERHNERDEHQKFADFIAEKIRKLPSSDQGKVQHKIQNILYEAEQAAQGIRDRPHTQVKILQVLE